MPEENAATARLRLAGYNVIVTGAGTGIGQGTAVAMAKEGANLVIVGRSVETLRETEARIRQVGGKVLCLTGSVADPETAPRVVAATVETFGSLNVVVNNAHTFSAPLPLDQTPESDLRQHIESGFFGTFYFMQAAFPHMKQHGGSIINLGSMAGVQGWANFAPYAAAKEAIRGLSRSASRDWGQYKIRVNVIVPSSHSKISEEYFSVPGRLDAVLATIPLGYLGDPELDVGRVAVFLASDDARYITGQTLHADGGM